MRDVGSLDRIATVILVINDGWILSCGEIRWSVRKRGVPVLINDMGLFTNLFLKLYLRFFEGPPKPISSTESKMDILYLVRKLAVSQYSRWLHIG